MRIPVANNSSQTAASLIAFFADMLFWHCFVGHIWFLEDILLYVRVLFLVESRVP